MKAHAIEGRDKPKDAYDFCYCLDNSPQGIAELAKPWRKSKEKRVTEAKEILREKFASVDSFGPIQVAEFHSPQSADERNRIARRAFELVQAFLAACNE